MKHFLVVVDMQTDFIDGSLGSPEAAAIKPAVIDLIHTFSGEIWATVDTHGDNYLDTVEGRHLPVEHCIKGTSGWAIDREIATALNGRGAVFVEKPTFASLVLPQLIEDAADGEDFDVTLCGLCTDICVISNALLLKARFHEKEIFVRAACCAGVTPEKHLAALEVMRSCHINVFE